MVVKSKLILDKKYFLFIPIALLVATGAFYYANNRSDKPAVSNEQLEAEANAAEKENLIENNPTPANQDKSTVSADNATPPASDSNIKLMARQETNGTITVFTELKGYGSGSCELTITNGSKSTIKTADVIYQPQSSICAGFSVPINELGVGTWELSLKVTSGDSSSSSGIELEIK